VSALRDEQVWFAAAVMDGVDEQRARERLTPGPRLDADGRLAIYQRGYVARLVECLADDYPVTKHALGEDAFESLARAYIARHPSTSPNLNAYGRLFPQLCDGFYADLARLEWAIVEVIHAAAAPPLASDALQAVPADRWPSIRLTANPALRVLRFAYPANAYFQAVRDGQETPIPAAAPSAAVVYRSGLTVWRMNLSESMVGVLSALVAAEPLETALSRVGEGDPPERVMAWFRDWIASGLFVGVG
jgi:hypothetical protein